MAMATPREEKRALESDRKELMDDRRKLVKDQDEWRTKKSGLQRDTVRLTSLKKELERQTTTATGELEAIQAEIALAKDSLTELNTKNSDLEVENHRLEENITVNTHDLDEVRQTLDEQKKTLDSQLAAYALEKKQAIKNDILAVNNELTTLKEEIVTSTALLEQQRTELRELNQVYIDEQTELKVSSAETKRMIEENETRIEETKNELEALHEKRQQAQYDYDHLMIAVTKAREEHTKFLEYEKQARKILDTKDRQLQKSAADLATEGQFVRNQRSFLPPM